MKLRVSTLAERDLDAIWEYVAKNAASQESANRIVDRIVEACVFLAQMPEAGAKRDSIEPGLCAFPAQSYMIYYRQQGRVLLISRILHGRRDQAAVFEET
jgi:toxin ParE1/3/4